MTRSDFLLSAWRKSSHSESGEGTCIEVAAAWRKSSYSESQEGTCVEVARGSRLVAVRDSKDPDGSVLTLTSAGWRKLLASLKSDGA